MKTKITIKRRYSAHANLDVINFLLNNNISFVCRKGILCQHRSVFFITDEASAMELEKQTVWCATDETNGCDFDKWDALAKGLQF